MTWEEGHPTSGDTKRKTTPVQELSGDPERSAEGQLTSEMGETEELKMCPLGIWGQRRFPQSDLIKIWQRLESSQSGGHGDGPR